MKYMNGRSLEIRREDDGDGGRTCSSGASEKSKTMFLFLCDVFECQQRTRAPWPKIRRKSIFILSAVRWLCYHRNSLFISRAVGVAVLVCHGKSLWGHDRGDTVRNSWLCPRGRNIYAWGASVGLNLIFSTKRCNLKLKFTPKCSCVMRTCSRKSWGEGRVITPPW